MIGIVYGYCVKHGGVGRYITETITHFKNPSNFELLTIEKNSNTPTTKTILINCERDLRFMSIKENKSFSNKIKELFEKYDIIHSHGVYDFLLDIYTAHICLASYFGKFIEIFGKEYLPEHLRKDYHKLINLEERMLSNLHEEGLIAVSNKVAEDLSNRYKISKKRIEIVSGSSRFCKEKGTENKKKDFCTIGFTGGNLYAKGIVFMKDIFNRLVSKGIRLRCVGVGCNDDIKKFLETNSRYEINVMGKSDIQKDFYRKLDIYLCLSIYEGYSLSTLEAMSLGVPVISSNLNGVFYDAKEELPLARIEDVSDTNEVIGMIEKIIFDEYFRNKVVDSGYKIVNRLSWADVATKYESIYQKFL